MKDTNEVIDEFNDIVNMTSSELEKWLKSGDSRSAGWPKDEDGGDGESVGHDSGRRIVEILKANPDKDPEKYTDEQIQHMRKVVSYCKRHLAQEEKMMQEKSTEEIKKTKSYASLKNWGHDPLKNTGDDGEDGEEEEEEQGEDDEDEQEADDGQAGDKRKKSTKAQSGSNKKRETRQGKATSNGKKNEEDQEEDEDDDDDEYDDGEEEEGEEGDDEEDDGKKANGKSNGNGNDSSGKKPKKGPKPGDTVSWNWGNGQPQGKVLDVKGEKTSVETKRGNEVTRDGDPEDPAVVLDTGKSKAIKSNHELVDTED